MSRHSIYRWERGEITNPNRDQLHAVLDALGVPREDAYRALGILPPDESESTAVFGDPDEQAIWDLGERRAWTEDHRMRLVYAHRAWQQEYDPERVAAYVDLHKREDEAIRDAARRTG